MINQISVEVSNKVPIILYAKTPSDRLRLFSNCKVSGISLDHQTKLSDARKILPSSFTLQGNLNPNVMETSPDNVEHKTLKLLNEMQGDSGHILNLGHGIRPNAKIECMEALVKTTRNFSVK